MLSQAGFPRREVGWRVACRRFIREYSLVHLWREERKQDWEKGEVEPRRAVSIRPDSVKSSEAVVAVQDCPELR